MGSRENGNAFRGRQEVFAGILHSRREMGKRWPDAGIPEHRGQRSIPFIQNYGFLHLTSHGFPVLRV